MANTVRVQIPAYTDRWMMGDRYGEVTRTWLSRNVKDKYGMRAELHAVKLDKSGKVVTVIANDCTEV